MVPSAVTIGIAAPVYEKQQEMGLDFPSPDLDFASLSFGFPSS